MNDRLEKSNTHYKIYRLCPIWYNLPFTIILMQICKICILYILKAPVRFASCAWHPANIIRINIVPSNKSITFVTVAFSMREKYSYRNVKYLASENRWTGRKSGIRFARLSASRYRLGWNRFVVIDISRIPTRSPRREAVPILQKFSARGKSA